MINRVKILIVDSDTRFVEQVCSFLKSCPDIEIIGTAQEGLAALQQIKENHPDAVLFDLVLPGLDGITLLRLINEEKNPPATICCTRFYSDVAQEAMRTYGASYLLFKPIELRSLYPAIISSMEMHQNICKLRRALLMDECGNKHNSAQIHNYIVSLGVPAKLIGCSYLTEAVLLAKSDDTLLRNLSKGLYLEIARRMNTTPTRIERCIRTAISAAYHGGGLYGKMVTCPSNKEFIHYVLSKLDL